MAIRNPNWYAGNATKRYPLADCATGRTDAGVSLPHDLLVDLQVRVPETVGRYVLLSSIAVTPTLVSLTLLASDTQANDPAETPTFLPLASCSLAKPVESFRNYSLTPLYPGVGGWVVFGQGIESSFQGRFSTVQQGMLLPKVARFYRPSQVTSLGKRGTYPALTGEVLLLGGQDIEVVGETMLVGDRERRVIVIRLKNQLDRNVFELYRGECTGRPESETCLYPPVRYLNGLQPDCSGNLELLFPDATVYPYSPNGGLEINYPLGLADICDRNAHLPSDGKLPFAGTSNCPEDADSYSFHVEGNEFQLVELADPWQHTELDTDLLGNAEWRVAQGNFTFVRDDKDSEQRGLSPQLVIDETGSSELLELPEVYEASPSFVNLSLYPEIHPPGRFPVQGWVDVRMLPGSHEGNAALVANFKHAEPYAEYYYLELNKTKDKLRLMRTVNGRFHILDQTQAPLGLRWGEWYRLQLQARQGAAGLVQFKGTLHRFVDTHGTTEVAGQVFALNDAVFGTGGGYWGVLSRYARTRFSWFRVL